MELSSVIIILLITTGILVGMLNTYAGAAGVITLTLFSAMGIPISVANGTNRIPILMQTITMSIGFRKQGVLNIYSGLKLSIPSIIGAVIGSYYANVINPTIFEFILATMLIAILFFNPTKIKNNNILPTNIKPIHYFLFLLVGLYGGMFHVGVGYLILSVAILSMGYDFIQASAIKGFIVLMYTPFALAIFIAHDQVDFVVGLIHGTGNIIGAAIATAYAKKIPMNLIKYSLFVMIIVTILDLVNIISLESILNNLFKTLL